MAKERASNEWTAMTWSFGKAFVNCDIPAPALGPPQLAAASFIY